MSWMSGSLEAGCDQCYTRVRRRSERRDSASAEYFVRWIDKLTSMAEQWPWWRSPKERDHVFAEFNEARRVYKRLAAEANQVHE